MNSNLNITRRDYLYGLGSTLGTIAFNALLQQESMGDERAEQGPLSIQTPHHAARAQRCIFIFLEGGPSHIDTFDPKPALEKVHLQKFTRQNKLVSNMGNGKRYYVASPFKFKQVSDSGIHMNTEFSQLAGVADQLCVFHGLQGDSINHPTACYHMNTGNRFGGDPAIGSWVTYGLGSVNQNLPGFVVLPQRAYPQGGAANWSNGFLPPYYQGTTLRPDGSAILDISPPPGVTPEMQRQNLNLLQQLNQDHLLQHPEHQQLSARMQAYELAYRMQSIVPGLLDISQESKTIQNEYGVGDKYADQLGRKCLMARRLLEQGVRFVQLYHGGWDSHDYIERSHRARIRAMDQPVAALIKDLQRRDMLQDTLIVMVGEFGRTPDNGIRSGGVAYGRDHNNQAMFALLAGAGVGRGQTIGKTDELGFKAVDVVHPIRNFHATLLHLLGLNDNKLTFFHAGRYKQLSQTGAELIPEILG
jgi:hypothetical protein